MSNISRRSFLKKSTALTGAVSLFAISGAKASGNIIGANDRIRVAVSGVGDRGTYHISEFGKQPNVEVAWVVDADNKRVQSAVARVEENFKNTPQGAQDIRKMLDDKSVDAVSIGSCNHWHALMTIWACQAGKDVYVEKPCSQNLFEGRKMVEAAEKYNRLVQHGTQRRSETTWAKAVAAARSGKYGKLIAAKAYAHRPRGPLGFKPIAEPPANLDWDLWCGPAPKMEYHANLAPYNWHWFWDTGNGEIGNNGVHYFDLCNWLFDQGHPQSVISFGTRFVNDAKSEYKDQAETPNIQFALYDFGGVPLVFESCNLAGAKDKWQPREEAEFLTEDGAIRGGKFFPNDGKEAVNIDVEFEAPAPGGPFGNFLNAMRNRDSVKLNAPIAKGFYSAAICHWANAAYRTGKPDTLASIREKMGDNPVMQESIKQVMTNALTVLKVKLDDIPLVVSSKLAIDRDKDKFVDNAVADQFLTRAPRKPFDVPEQV